VTADGDPVGRMLDQSGNGNHAVQTVSGSRPVYRTDGTLHWLQGNGVNAELIDTTPYRVDSVFAAATLEVNDDVVVGLGDGDRQDAFLFANAIYLQNGINSSTSFNASSSARVLSGQFANNSFIRVDGQESKTTNLTSISGIKRIGKRNFPSTFTNGKLFGLLLIDKTLSISEIEKTENYLASLSGVTL